MRNWYKYSLSDECEDTYKCMDSSFADHAKALGLNAETMSIYCSKDSFFNNFFYNRDYGRLESYHNFLIKHLQKNYDILSIASGRCANELLLMELGYNSILCSDLEKWANYENLKSLFPNLNFIELDILREKCPKKFSAIISLSLIYLFNDNDLHVFLENISNGLSDSGIFILDSAGSEDTFYSYCFHDIYLKFEIHIVQFLFNILHNRKKYGVIKKHHGYRRTNKEIINAAKKYNLKVIDQKNFAFANDLRRSLVFNLFIKPNSITEKIIQKIVGKRMPYIRMFAFRRD